MTPDQFIIVLLIAGPLFMGSLIIYVIFDGRAESQRIREQNVLLENQTQIIVQRMKADTDYNVKQMHRDTQIILAMVLKRVDRFSDDDKDTDP